MKLQNMTVIFIIIILPIILLTTYYISLQVDTMNMQGSYNEKLLEAVRESISAFEINTVEWNEAYSETADSKRRDIMASVNTFINSFANAMGMGGISKEHILPYIPALAYTLYDGYYIYSPAETKETVKNKNGVTVFITQELANSEEMEKGNKYIKDRSYDGKMLYQYDKNKGGSKDGSYNGIDFTLDPDYAKTTYSHILKPFSSYSARYKNTDTDITVNYTLDNYITIYGKVKGTYKTRSGYFIDISNINITENNWQDVTLENGIKMNKEKLTENVAWKYREKDNYTIGIYNYVYEAENNTKVYFENKNGEDIPFQINSNGIRTNLNDLPNPKYKKLVVLGNKKEGTCTEYYQALNSKNRIKQGEWYLEMNKANTTVKPDVVNNMQLKGIDLKEDVSAINYYVQAYSFTTWVKKNLGDIKVENMVGEKSWIEVEGNIFNYKEDPEDEASLFFRHKREVIKKIVSSNLNQAITSYSRNSEGTYRLPILGEADWDQILRNVSVIAFVQNIPIGLKTYNNYAIATSTSNKEYVDPDKIYLSVAGDEYYHLPYCSQITGDNMIGYRSIDYIAKSYEENNKSNYYFLHSNNSYQADYYCLVQHSLYQKESKKDRLQVQKKVYQTALARERYVAHSFSK